LAYTKVEIVKKTNDIIRMEIPVYQAREGEKLAAGQHAFNFEMILPDWLPPSLIF
jgi:hypothetical protein